MPLNVSSEEGEDGYYAGKRMDESSIEQNNENNMNLIHSDT